MNRTLFISLSLLGFGGHSLLFATHPGWWDQALAALERVLVLLLYLTWFRAIDLERKVPYHVYLLNLLWLAASAFSIYWTSSHPHSGWGILFPMVDYGLAAGILVLLLMADMMTESLRKGNRRL